jgi:hypothetical protein
MHRNNIATSPERVTRALNARTALELRLAGLNFDEIGGRMGFSRQRAHALVSEELARVNAERNERAAELIRVEAERLDRLQAAVWPRALAGELRAVDRVLSIMARRARLLALDAQPEYLTREQARELMGLVVKAVTSCVTDPETLGKIHAKLDALAPGAAAEPPSGDEMAIDDEALPPPSGG